MKKVLLIAAMALVSLGASAQLLTSRTFVEKKRTTTWVLRAGVNVMGMAGEGAKNLDSRAGYDVAISFEKPISDFGLNWGMEFALGSRGYSAENSGYTQKLISHNFRWSPFTLGYGYNLTDDFKIAVHLGAFASVDYAGSFTREYKGESESNGLGDIEDYQRFDAGMALGGGLWYKRVNLDVTWQRGFIDVISDSKCQASNVMIRLGLAF